MRPGSASYRARAGAPAVKLSRGRAKADPWWCRDPKNPQALLESFASSWARGDRAALSDRVDMEVVAARTRHTCAPIFTGFVKAGVSSLRLRDVPKFREKLPAVRSAPVDVLSSRGRGV